jgi:hypothetical protein
MGANKTQAVGVTAFLLAFVAMPAAYWGGILVFLLGVALLVVAVIAFLKCKPWETAENGGSN